MLLTEVEFVEHIAQKQIRYETILEERNQSLSNRPRQKLSSQQATAADILRCKVRPTLATYISVGLCKRRDHGGGCEGGA